MTPTSSNLRNFRPKRDRRNSQNHVDRSLEDLAILFRAFLDFLPLFQSSYGGFKTIGAINTFEIATSYLSCFTSMSHGSVGIVQKIDFEIRPDLGCTTFKTSRKVVLDNRDFNSQSVTRDHNKPTLGELCLPASCRRSRPETISPWSRLVV